MIIIKILICLNSRCTEISDPESIAECPLVVIMNLTKDGSITTVINICVARLCNIFDTIFQLYFRISWIVSACFRWFWQVRVTFSLLHYKKSEQTLLHRLLPTLSSNKGIWKFMNWSKEKFNINKSWFNRIAFIEFSLGFGKSNSQVCTNAKVVVHVLGWLGHINEWMN